MESDSAIPDTKTPVDAGLSFASLHFQSADLAAEGFLIQDTLPGATAGGDSELDLRHIRNRQRDNDPTRCRCPFSECAGAEQQRDLARHRFVHIRCELFLQ